MNALSANAFTRAKARSECINAQLIRLETWPRLKEETYKERVEEKRG